MRTVKDWTLTFDRSLWLKPDATGPADAAFLVRILRLPAGSRILDAPCGTGRISLPLALAGYRVTGVDRQPSYIRRARRRASGQENASFLVADMRKARFDDQFDAVINWGGSFGYFSDMDNQDLVRAFARAVGPRGKIVIDQPNREHLLRHFRTHVEQPGLHITNIWDRSAGRMHSEWKLKKGGRLHTNRMSVRLYTLMEMKTLFRRAGCRLRTAYGSVSGEGYGRTSRRLIVVGIRGPG
jgi:SAM-dependent methyltransferase